MIRKLRRKCRRKYAEMSSEISVTEMSSKKHKTLQVALLIGLNLYTTVAHPKINEHRDNGNHAWTHHKVHLEGTHGVHINQESARTGPGTISMISKAAFELWDPRARHSNQSWYSAGDLYPWRRSAKSKGTTLPASSHAPRK